MRLLNVILWALFKKSLWMGCETMSTNDPTLETIKAIIVSGRKIRVWID